MNVFRKYKHVYSNYGLLPNWIPPNYIIQIRTTTFPYNIYTANKKTNKLLQHILSKGAACRRAKFNYLNIWIFYKIYKKCSNELLSTHNKIKNMFANCNFANILATFPDIPQNMTRMLPKNNRNILIANYKYISTFQFHQHSWHRTNKLTKNSQNMTRILIKNATYSWQNKNMFQHTNLANILVKKIYIYCTQKKQGRA